MASSTTRRYYRHCRKLSQSQFVLPWMNQNNRISTFRGKHYQGKDISFLMRLMMLDINFPREKNNLIARSSLIPDLTQIVNHIQLQPILGLPWPTVILEVNNSEPLSKLIEHRNEYLGRTTQLNLYVGVSYRGASRQIDSWWICVAHRDIHAPQPPPGATPRYLYFPSLWTNCRRPPAIGTPLSISLFPQPLPPGQYLLTFCFIQSPFLSWIHHSNRHSILTLKNSVKELQTPVYHVSPIYNVILLL